MNYTARHAKTTTRDRVLSALKTLAALLGITAAFLGFVVLSVATASPPAITRPMPNAATSQAWLDAYVTALGSDHR